MAGAIPKYHCNYCEENITTIRVKCHECADFDLCLQCFSCGAEIGGHKNKHSYQLIDCGTFPIFSPPNGDKWQAKDEVSLLEAIEQYGFGNWADIANSIGINDLTATEAEEHYSNYYILGNIGRSTWTNVDSDFSMRDHTCPNSGPLSPSLTTPLPAITEVNQKGQDALGYLPKRDDFEREYDNEAESLVSTLACSADDDELETALKTAHVNMYQRRLADRFRKKHIVREYGLVYQFFKNHPSFASQREQILSITPQRSSNSPNKKKNQTHSQSQRDEESEQQKNRQNEFNSCLDDKFKCFLRFESFEENREFVRNLQREKELKIRIKELMRLRKNGLKKMSECAAFESARNKREKRKENKKKAIPNSNIGCAHRRLLTMDDKEGADIRGTASLSPNNTPKKGSAKESSEFSKKCDVKEEFDIFSLPNCRLLSETEKKLCTSMRLRPSHYITLKTLIIKDCAQKRKGSSTSKSSLENIDKSMRRKIVNFMSKNGWIT